MSRPTYLRIDAAALQHNLARVRELAPNSKVIAMVKANAYGHGLVRAAKVLQVADALGVASLDEGMQLREAGIKTPIVLMEGLFYPEELPIAGLHDFTLVVHHKPQLQILEHANVTNKFNVWLKLDTGMHRLGVKPERAASLYRRLDDMPNVNQVGLMTHFAEADLTGNDTTHRQIEIFRQAIRELTGPCSMANSAGILAWPDAHGDWVRPGLMVYGASPFKDKTGLDHGLRPVMTLWSRLIAVKKIQKGDKVGYGGTFVAPREMRIGVVGVGYGDGYPQFASTGTPILVKGKRCELIGRVSMDMLTVDLTNQPEAQVGDEVVLWGEGLPVELVARHSQTSPYEILTRMTPRPMVDVSNA